jgi:hypothetical protein
LLLKKLFQLLKKLFPKEGENLSTENLQKAEIVENEKVENGRHNFVTLFVRLLYNFYP